jgi:hypothetical protein
VSELKNILVTAVADLHALQKSSFWVVLDNRGWCLLMMPAGGFLKILARP